MSLCSLTSRSILPALKVINGEIGIVSVFVVLSLDWCKVLVEEDAREH